MSRGKQKQTPELIRLWGEVWERWRWSEGRTGEAIWVESVEREPTPQGSPATLAVPARLALAAPLWIDSVDETLVDEMVRLELDVRGLLGKRQAAGDAVVRTVAVTPERTLVLATVFPAALPEAMPVALFDQYEASPFLRPLSANSLTLWREGGDLVAALTRDERVLYWEAIGWTDDSREIGGWLGLVCLQLRAEGVIEGALSFVNELPGFKTGVIALPEGVVAEPPDADGPEARPVLAGGIFRWRPPLAVAAATAAIRARQMRQIAYAAAAMYAGVALIVGLYLGYQSLRKKSLLGEANNLQAEVGQFEPVSREWRRIAATAAPEFFPLEVLHHIVKHLPEDGVRLTIFNVEGGRVLVEGDANPQRLTSPFFEAISIDPELIDYAWDMPQPTLRPDGSAKFSIQGTFALPELP